MCQPHHPRNTISITIHPARKVVKKYRKMSLRKEMRRLREIVAVERGQRISSEQLLDRTVDLISELEARLISQIRDRGLPDKMVGIMSQMGLQWDSSMDMMREVVGQMMVQKV